MKNRIAVKIERAGIYAIYVTRDTSTDPVDLVVKCSISVNSFKVEMRSARDSIVADLSYLLSSFDWLPQRQIGQLIHMSIDGEVRPSVCFGMF
jgi:hypothetical protein